MANFNIKKDYYKILGVNEDATAEEITKTFRQQAGERHPDRGGSEEDMKSLNEAYKVLGNDDTRKAYNSGRGIKSDRGTDSNDERRASPSFNFESVEARSGGDVFGLFMGALICLGFGVPLLLLIEIQWVFFLWPLRIIAGGLIFFGLFLSRAAFRHKHREMMKAKNNYSRAREIAGGLLFWFSAVMVAVFFYLLMEAVAR
jgi:curved DNA-binding protein CbpA